MPATESLSPEVLQPYLLVTDVASRLQISRAKVYMLLEAGELKSVSIGRCRRVRREDLLAYEASLTGGGEE